MNGALAWTALIMRYASDTAPESFERDPQRQGLSSELTASEIALHEWQENIRKLETSSGDNLNASLKKALFLDKAPRSVRVPPRMQNLATYAMITAVTLQFLSHSTVAGRCDGESQQQKRS